MRTGGAMPFIGELTMEFCDQATEGVSLEDLVAAARLTPRGPDWFLTLSRPGEDFMDAVLDENGAVTIQCSEAGTRWLSDGPIDEALLESLFVSFYEHDNLWKQRCAWKEPKKRGLLDFFR
jgi:hypothetical protein